MFFKPLKTRIFETNVNIINNSATSVILLRPELNGRHFADDTFEFDVLNNNV